MTAFSDYVQKQAMAAEELPMVHTTEYFRLRAIQSTNTLQASACKVFGESLLYFFYGRPINIDHTRVSTVNRTSLTNFPVLVSITDPDLKASAQTNGADILFTAADGVTKLNHEIESYDSTHGVLAAWVQVPTMSNSADVGVYLYYGNPTAVSQASPASVWSNGFVLVDHLDETLTSAGQPVHDSTGLNNGQAYGNNWAANQQVPGVAGGGLNIVSGDDIIVPSSASLQSMTSITASFWLKTSSLDSTIRVGSSWSRLIRLRGGA